MIMMIYHIFTYEAATLWMMTGKLPSSVRIITSHSHIHPPPGDDDDDDDHKLENKLAITKIQ